MFRLGKSCCLLHATTFDQPSSDSEGTLPRPTSIEALLHPTPHPVVDDLLADPRLASARNWTTVTNDADLLISILSSWTAQEYSYYHYLDRDAFLDDMASSRADFCSELLTNALLASACVSSAYTFPISAYHCVLHMLTLLVYQLSCQGQVHTILRSQHCHGLLQGSYSSLGA